jgi:hypothetical protein
MKDENLLSLLPRIAMIDTRLCELWERLGSNETGATWALLRELSDEADEVLRDKRLNQETRNLTFTGIWKQMLGLIKEGLDEHVEWHELLDVSEKLRRHVDTEAKRIKTLAEIVSQEDAKAFVRRLLLLVRQNVDDKTFARIAYDIERDANSVRSRRDQGEELSQGKETEEEA